MRTVEAIFRFSNAYCRSNFPLLGRHKNEIVRNPLHLEKAGSATLSILDAENMKRNCDSSAS